MESEWQTTTFEEAPLEVIDGDRGVNYPHQDEFSKTGYCLFLNAGNVTMNGFRFSDCAFICEKKDQVLRKGKLKRHDVVLTTRGTVGNVAYFDNTVPYDHIRINSGMVILRALPAALQPRYLYLFVRSPLFREQIKSLRTGSAQPQLPIRDINRIEIPLPALEKQKAIAHILGTLDDKIELNRRMNATLEGIARAIFKSWFVDFDPVRAKAEGRDTGLPKHIADLFPDRLMDSELGEIPEGWEVRPLSEVIHINPIRSLPKGTHAPYLDMANMPTSGPTPQSWVMREMGSGMKFINGDTLIARITPCLENGKTAFVNFLADSEVGWGSTEYIVLRPKGAIPLIFAYLLARNDEFRTFAIQQMTGSSGRQRVPATSLHNYKIAIPALDSILHEHFGNLVSPIFDRIKAAMSESRALSTLRDTLLPKLISGELPVPDAEKIVRSTTS